MVDLKKHFSEKIAHAQRTKHIVLGSMVLAAICAATGNELLALALNWSANLIWIYET